MLVDAFVVDDGRPRAIILFLSAAKRALIIIRRRPGSTVTNDSSSSSSRFVCYSWRVLPLLERPPSLNDDGNNNAQEAEEAICRS